jgi:predicted Zn finger-like uncharacterized protein
MNVFCENCQKTIGQVPDAKIPANKIVAVKCPHCEKQIKLQKTNLEANAATLQNHSVSSPPTPPPLPGVNRMNAGNSHSSGSQPNLTRPPANALKNPHKLWKQLIGLGIASIIFATFNVLGVITGIFTFIDAWKAGIYKNKNAKSFINISPMGWGIVMQGIFIVGYPLYLASRNKLKTLEGEKAWYILTIIFGSLTFVALAFKIIEIISKAALKIN